MFPGLNPKKMQAMMKQMGMAQEEIDANRVIKWMLFSQAGDTESLLAQTEIDQN